MGRLSDVLKELGVSRALRLTSSHSSRPRIYCAEPPYQDPAAVPCGVTFLKAQQTTLVFSMSLRKPFQDSCLY